MSYKFAVQVDSAMMRSAWHAWFFRGQRIWTLVVAMALIVGSAAFDLRSGSLGTVSIVGLTVLGFAVLLFSVGYFVGLRSSLSKLEAIVDGRATYTLSHATIEVVSSLGSISLDWSAMAELRRYRDLILLGFRGAMYSTIPASQIPDEALSFMIERCRASGAQITGL